MYKVLIIDDEVLVRVGLKTTVNWEEMGFTVVADAANGEQGYAQYKKHNPDVIITDIKMPKQDGLSLTEKVRKENQDVRILVLTCYDEFSFARKALKLGADDYILKSEVEDEELVEVMTGIKDKLDAQSITENTHEVKNNLSDMKKSLFDDLVKSDFNLNDKVKERCSKLDFPVLDTKFILTNIVISKKTVQNKSQSGNSQQVNDAIANIIFEQLVAQDIKYLYNNDNNNYLFLLSSSKMKISEVKTIFNSICNAAKQYFDISLKIVYTNLFKEINKIYYIYKKFTKKTQILFYEDEESVLITKMDSINFNDANVFDLKKQFNKTFNKYIGQGNIEDTVKLNYEVSEYFKENRMNPMIVKIFYSNLMGDIFDSFEQFFSNNQEIKHYEYYHFKIINSKKLESIVKLVSCFFQKVIDEIKHSKNSSKLIVNRALNYIEDNYDKKISLENIATELNVSKNYLCNVFKRETGENTSLYINKLRIEKAKKMLLKKDYRIKELFGKVGFSNQYYFSKVFKKITGMTITDYKESRTVNNS